MTGDQILMLKENLDADLIETHISWILLTEERAYKIKKPVTFSFLDFSSISTRKEMCLKEVELNSRLSDIYLDVVSVYHGVNGVSLEENGLLVDYAVEMKLMPNDRRMDVLLKDGEVEKRDIETLAIQIADFHSKAVIIREEDDMQFVDQRFKNLLAARDYLIEVYGEKAKSIVDNAMGFHLKFMVENGSSFNQRVAVGYKRDLHGDLHSQNIFLLEKAVIFDCIEFDSRYRYIDVLSELAFLYMDLESHGKRDYAIQFLKEYGKKQNILKTEMEKVLFHYYLCYRANVRLKVNALREMQEDKRIQTTETNRYLSLLEKYLSPSFSYS